MAYLDTWMLNRRAGKLSIFDRFNLAFLPPDKTLISGLDQTKLAVGADTSHWNGKLTDELVAGADAVMPKATDGLQVVAGSWYDRGTFRDDHFHETVDTAYKVGRPVIPYHYFQWKIQEGWTHESIIDHQFNIIMDAFKNLIPGVSYHGFAIDIEERGDTDTNMKWKVESLHNRLKNSEKFRDVPILFYSSNYFLNMWPALRDWLSFQGAGRNLWLAQWSYTKAFVGSWAEWRAQVLPTIEMKVLTPGYASWTAVQWSASCKIAGFTVDVNSFTRTRDGLYEWLKYKPATTPQEPPKPPVDDSTGDDTQISALKARLDALEGIVAGLDKFRTNVKGA